jgi:L-asparaginase II
VPAMTQRSWAGLHGRPEAGREGGMKGAGEAGGGCGHAGVLESSPGQAQRAALAPEIATENPVLAEVVRSGFTESRHRGAIAAAGPDGTAALSTGGVALRAGAVDTPIFPRSSNKPMQAAAMLRCGLDLGGELLALAAASHSGEDFHVAGVREILARAGLSEDALRCPPDLPSHEPAWRRMVLAGAGPDRVHMNCSGKHAAMLATCVAAGWPTASYTEPDHPLQAEIRRTIERLAGEPVTAVGVDGCGAPLFALTLTGLARAFGALVRAEPGSRERRVADAMRAYPGWMSGTGRPDRRLMEAVPGLLLKSGAEGVAGLALADGRAAAFKIDDGDGARRALVAVTVALLRALGVGDEPGADREALADMSRPPVIGGGRAVGEIRATLPF